MIFFQKYCILYRRVNLMYDITLSQMQIEDIDINEKISVHSSSFDYGTRFLFCLQMDSDQRRQNLCMTSKYRVDDGLL